MGRASSYWWLYAAVPRGLPANFPLELPGGRILCGHARLCWSAVLCLLILRLYLEIVAASHSDVPVVGPSLTLSLDQGFSSYACTSTFKVLLPKVVLQGGAGHVFISENCAQAHQAAWAIPALLRDICSCLTQVCFVLGACALMPRRGSSLARAGQASLMIMCMHEYALSLFDYPLAQIVRHLSEGLGWSTCLISLFACLLLAVGIAKVRKEYRPIPSMLSVQRSTNGCKPCTLRPAHCTLRTAPYTFPHVS